MLTARRTARHPRNHPAGLALIVVQFDEDDYHKRYLLRNARGKNAEEFKARVSELNDQLTGKDARQFIHAGDFITAPSWYLRKRQSGWMLKDEALRDAVISCTEFADLRGEPMFAELERLLTR